MPYSSKHNSNFVISSTFCPLSIVEQRFEYESFVQPETLIAAKIVKQEIDESVGEFEALHADVQRCAEATGDKFLHGPGIQLSEEV